MTLSLRLANAAMRSAGALAIALGMLVGCASPGGAQIGATRADIVTNLGAPVSETPLPGGGERLLYTTQPFGFSVFHLEFDVHGRLVRREQVLTQDRLASIPVGQWTVADVQRTFGPPMRVERVARFDGDIWTYRFMDDFYARRQGHVHIDRTGVVRLVMFTDEPQPGDDRGFF